MSGIKMAVFVSGGGTNLQEIIDQIKNKTIAGTIEVVIASKEDAYALQRAKQYGIEGIYIGKKNYPDEEKREERILGILREKEIDLIVLAGYMQRVGSAIIQAYKHRIINIHPALIPSFCGKGFYGKRVHQAVLDYGTKITGATVHFVDEGMDTGPIILQKAVEVKAEDTVDTLAERVLAVEHEILPQVIRWFGEGRLEVRGRRVYMRDDAK